MTQTIKGVGRDGSLPETKALLIIASRLQKKGDAVSAAFVKRLLGITYPEAQKYIAMLLGAGDENTGRYLPLSGDEDGVSLEADPGYACHDLRLSRLETMALAAALDLVGISSDNPLRKRVMRSHASPLDSDDIFSEAARPSYPIPTDLLLRCALAIINERPLSFDYQGTRDTAPRKRRVRPCALNPNDGKWTLDAYDLDADGERTFYLANIDNLTLLDTALPRDAAPNSASERRRIVGLRFADKRMLELFEWPDLEIVSEQDGAIEARIPFYGGPWLVRRIAAGGGSVTTTDAELASMVRDYAAGLLTADQRRAQA